MSSAIDIIKEEIPKEAKISDITYEGSEIIVYTKNKEFFTSSTDLIKKIVGKIKKRIEVRSDPSIIIGEEETKDIIRKVVPQEAGIKDIYFEPEFARVVIHAEKPGLVIGKNGETLLSIKEKTLWTPYIYRAPVIDSDLIKSIRKMLHKEAGYRRKFLNQLGEKIYKPGKEVEWIRLTALGAFREVGRSCSLLQTPQSKILFDCGMSVSAVSSKPYPYIDAPEFKIQELDAVVLSHAHMDHCLPPETTVMMKSGNTKDICLIKEGDKVASIDWSTGKLSEGTCVSRSTTKSHKILYKITTQNGMIEASPNHKIFVLRSNEIEEVEAREIENTDLIPMAGDLIQNSANSFDYILRTKTNKIVWQKIEEIEIRENPYEELIDIEVLPHRNFIANGVVVHNSGLVPFLYEYGYRGPLYCTRPTRDIAALLQLDYLQICQRENKKPLYTSKGIEEAIKHTVTLDYDEVSDITPDMRLTFGNAGHLLGSAVCHVHIGDGLYNFLYSLDSQVPVVLINPKGELVVEQIGKLVDKQIESQHVPNSFVQEAWNEDGWKTIAFDPKTLKTEVVPITSFVRHPITEKLYKIKTECGKETTVTASHNVFQAVDGEVVSVKTKDLKIGQFILSAKGLPIEEKIPVIELSGFESDIRLIFDNPTDKAEEFREVTMNNFPKKYEKILIYLKEHFDGKFLFEISKKHGVKASTIRRYFGKIGIKLHPRRGHTFPNKLNITPNLARFLGYYIAEGHSLDNTVRITNYDKTVLEDCYKICRDELGIEGKIYDKVVVFSSKQFEFLLKNVLNCGDSAFTKRVPRAILEAPSDVVWEFLRGYYDGDGSLRIRESGCEISANSKSSELIRDISIMLLGFGITSSLEFNKTSEMYMAKVASVKDIEKILKLLNITDWNEKYASKQHYRIRSSVSDRIPISALSISSQSIINKTSYQNASSTGLLTLQKLANLTETDTKLVNSSFVFAKILSIEEVEPTSQYVYDLSVDGYENFLTAQGFLFVHNTGDIKYERTKLFEKATTDFTRAETVMIEATYGANEDIASSHKDGEKMLIDNIKKALARGGRVLIPSFAVGRSQDVIHCITDSDIDVPIYLDGMLWDATAIHTAYPEFMAQNVQTAILHKGNNPFTDPRLKGIGSQKERMEIFNSNHPCVVLSTSGMLMGGPAIEYLKNFADEPKNMLLFVGYRAEGSPGRRIQKGWKQIQLDNGHLLNLNLEIETVRGLSGHSDQRQLLAYLQHMKNKPRKVIVNHCENSKCVEFARTVHKNLRIESVAPENLETVRLR